MMESQLSVIQCPGSTEWIYPQIGELIRAYGNGCLLLGFAEKKKKRKKKKKKRRKKKFLVRSLEKNKKFVNSLGSQPF